MRSCACAAVGRALPRWLPHPRSGDLTPFSAVVAAAAGAAARRRPPVLAAGGGGVDHHGSARDASRMTCFHRRSLATDRGSPPGPALDEAEVVRLVQAARDSRDVGLLERAQALALAPGLAYSPNGSATLQRARAALFDAWMERFDAMVPEEGAAGSSSSSPSSPSRALVADLRRSVEQAQAVLEALAPGLQYQRDPRGGGAPPARGHTRAAEAPDAAAASPAEGRPAADLSLTMRCNVLLQAWATLARTGRALAEQRHLHGIPQRAQYILQRMEATVAASAAAPPEPGGVAAAPPLPPTVESYNAVLAAWAYSQEHMRGPMAERVFLTIPRPDGDSFRLVVRAWCTSRDRRAAFTATGHLMKMLRRLESGEDSFEPTLEDYHLLFQAWETAEDKASPGKAQSVLRLMEYAFQKEITAVQPDLSCYRSILKTAAQRPNLPDLGHLVDDILSKMKERYIIPDSESFSAAIRIWRHSALHPENHEVREECVRRVFELLDEMKIAHNQSVATSVQMTTANINDALHALSVSRHPERTEKAEQLLNILETSFDKELDQEMLRPNADSYRLAINVWGTTDASDRVPRALSILRRMKEKLALLRAFNKPDDIVEVFNAFIRVCGSVEIHGDDSMGLAIYKEALASIESMKSIKGLRPDSTTYTVLLEAGKNLLPPGTHRQRLLEEMFRLCCDDGLVDESVLNMLSLAVSSEQYAKLVIAKSETLEGKKMVPESWTINVLGGRVLTTEGRRATPLSIDGRLTKTIAMKEYQMRRLRDKRNRNLLQGGRLKNKSLTTDVRI